MMNYFSLVVTCALAGCIAQTTDAAVLTPSTSMDTLPVVYMGGNSAPRPPNSIEMLSKMRYVVIEKWEGLCWDDCLQNLTKHHTQCSPECAEEKVQMATLQAVKELNPKIPGIFYLNTILDFHFLELHAKYVEADALLYNIDGSLCQLINDNGMTNITAFDYSKPVAQELWLGTIKNLTSTGVVDGFYGDTMQIYAVENATTGNWELCKKEHDTCCEMNATTGAAYNKGKLATMNAAAEFLGADAVFFKTTDFMIRGGHKDPVVMARAISDQLANMSYVHISAGDQKTDHDPNDTSSACDEDLIASFMLGWQKGAFLGCNGWDNSTMGRPIGHPLGPMQTEGNIIWRNFTSGTSATWDIKEKKGAIIWSD